LNNYTELQTAFTRWLNTLGFSHSIEYQYSRYLEEFFFFLQSKGIKQIPELNSTHLRTYFNYLQTRPNKVKGTGGLSAIHLNKNFDAIDKFLEFLHHIGMNNAPQPLKHRVEYNDLSREDKIQIFTQQEIKQLQANIKNSFPHFRYKLREKKHEQLKLIFVLCYACGLRRQEAHRLEAKDIDFDKKTIFIHQGKGYKDRLIPVNNNVIKALEHYIYNFRNVYKAKHNRLFIDQLVILGRDLKELQRITPLNTNKNKKLAFHILRHSIATHLLQNGISVENIGKFLGHSTLDSTQIYTHIANKP
jgi:integrase/recombinase XerD